jgi:peptidase E/N-acetylglutamate synthase-like GNAT family acetyltransferase
MNKQIFAMGGGGFSMEKDNPLLDKYLLSLSSKTKPKICFLATASGDAQGYIDRFYDSFKNYNCEPSHLSLFKAHTADFSQFLLSQDIIYVGGGNTKNLLVLWKEWGLDKILTMAYEKGIILAGISAGSICWFEQGVTDSIPGVISKINCLGFIRGSNCPHYNSELQRRPSFHKMIAENKILPGIATDDGVGLHYVDGHLEKIVSSHPDAKAYRLTRDNSGVIEKQAIPNYLGGKENLIRKASLIDSYAIHEAHMKSIQEICTPDYTEDQINAWGFRQYNQEQRHNSILNHDLWVLEAQGRIEGFLEVKIHRGEGMAELLGLYLTNNFAKQGYGKRLMHLMHEKCMEQGVSKVNLISTLTAKKFFEKMGAKPIKDANCLVIGGIGIPGIMMELSF